MGREKRPSNHCGQRAPGLDAELWLSASGVHDPSKSALIYSAKGLPFGWDLDVELDVRVEFSTNSPKRLSMRVLCDEAAEPISAPCREAAGTWNSQHNATGTALVVGEVGGRRTCKHSQGPAAGSPCLCSRVCGLVRSISIAWPPCVLSFSGNFCEHADRAGMLSRAKALVL